MIDPAGSRERLASQDLTLGTKGDSYERSAILCQAWQPEMRSSWRF